MKYQKKLISVLLALITIISPISFIRCMELSVSAEDINYDIPSINDEFADDTILIVYNNKASLSFLNNSKYELSNIDYDSIYSLSAATSEKIKVAMNNITQHISEGEELLPYAGIPVSEYNEVICVKLKNKGKENVIDAIKSLSKKEGIAYVGPDYYLDICSVEANATNFPDDPYASGS